MTDQYISVRETAQLLGINEKKVMDLIDNKELEAYRIANQFLRLKRSEVMELQTTGSVVSETIEFPYTKKERTRDFFYYNDFYILSFIFILALITIIFYV